MNRSSRLLQSFWFLPAVLCVLSVILAETLVVVDRRLADVDLGLLEILITRVGESGSRDLLGAVAGSTLAVASTTFSITIAVLALSSSTYGPRLVRNFMADRGNQFVLGVFVATFLYSLLVLRAIRIPSDGGGDYFVPHLAVNVAVLLAVLSIGVLVYFIHHISDRVQVWTLARQVRTTCSPRSTGSIRSGSGRTSGKSRTRTACSTCPPNSRRTGFPWRRRRSGTCRASAIRTSSP